MQRAGVQLAVVVGDAAAQPESAFALAKARMGYTLYPDVPRASDAGLCYIPVTDLPKISFGVYCSYDHDQPVLKRFLTLMSKYLKEEPQA